jgi:hypothetical protein
MLFEVEILVVDVVVMDHRRLLIIKMLMLPMAMVLLVGVLIVGVGMGQVGTVLALNDLVKLKKMRVGRSKVSKIFFITGSE